MSTIEADNIITKVIRKHYQTDVLHKFILRDFMAAKGEATFPFMELTEDQAEVVMTARKELKHLTPASHPKKWNGPL